MDERKALAQILTCKNLEFYCDFYSISVDDLKHEPQMAVYILKHKESLEKLITGYGEMSKLNSDICGEFQYCEQECQDLIC